MQATFNAEDPCSLLGLGSRGPVYLGTFGGAACAVKVIEDGDLSEAPPAQHRFVVSILAQLTQQQHTLEVRQLAAGGDLFNLVLESDGLEFDEAARYFQQLASAVAHCHEHGVAHGQLRPEGVLLSEDNALQLVGFRHGPASLSPLKPRRDSDAPEQLGQPRPSFQDRTCADVYAVGVLFLQMLLEAPPPRGSFEQICAEGLGVLPRAQALIPPPLQQLLRSMLHVEPHARPTATQVAAAFSPGPDSFAGGEGAASAGVAAHGGHKRGAAMMDADELEVDAQSPKSARPCGSRTPSSEDFSALPATPQPVAGAAGASDGCQAYLWGVPMSKSHSDGSNELA